MPPRRRKLTLAIQNRLGLRRQYGKTKFGRSRARRSSSRFTSISAKRRLGRGRSSNRRRSNRSSRSNRSGGARRVAMASVLKSLAQPFVYDNNTSNIIFNAINSGNYLTMQLGYRDPNVLKLLTGSFATAGTATTPSGLTSNSLNRIMIERWTTDRAIFNRSFVSMDVRIYTCKSRDQADYPLAQLLNMGFYQAQGYDVAAVHPTSQSDMYKDPASTPFDSRVFVQKVKILATKRIKLLPGQHHRWTDSVTNKFFDMTQLYTSFSNATTATVPITIKGERFYLIHFVPFIQSENQGAGLSWGTGMPNAQLTYDSRVRVKYFPLNNTLPNFKSDRSYNYLPAEITPIPYSNWTVEPMSGSYQPTDVYPVITDPELPAPGPAVPPGNEQIIPTS